MRADQSRLAPHGSCSGWHQAPAAWSCDTALRMASAPEQVGYASSVCRGCPTAQPSSAHRAMVSCSQEWMHCRCCLQALPPTKTSADCSGGLGHIANAAFQRQPLEEFAPVMISKDLRSRQVEAQADRAWASCQGSGRADSVY